MTDTTEAEPTPEPTTITFRGRAFTQLANLLLFASTSAHLPVLTGVRFEVENGAARGIATDSYALCIEELAVGVDGPDGTFLVPADLISDGLNASSYKGPRGKPTVRTLTMRIEGQEVTMIGGRAQLTDKLIGGEYPDYQKLMPTTDPVPVGTIGLTTLQLARLAKVRDPDQPSYKEPRLRFEFFGENKVGLSKPVRITLTKTTTILQMPCRIDS